MAAIGTERAQALIDAARQADITDEQLAACGYGSISYFPMLSGRDGDAVQRFIEQHAAKARAGLATPKQIDYIMTLLARRIPAGFISGPTDRAGVAALTIAQASTYIDSLTGRY